MRPIFEQNGLAVGKSDLLPILRDHSNNRELFDVTLRLLVNLTNPELLLFKEELPEDKETRKETAKAN